MSTPCRLSGYQRDRLIQYYYRFTDPETCELLFDEVREQQQAKTDCPHCRGSNMIGHGRYKQRRRYKCKDCSRTFNDFTATPLHGTHHPNKWIKFLECILKGLSLRRSAIRLHISWVTLFYWRHKIIHALKELDPQLPPADIPYKKSHRAYASRNHPNATPVPALCSAKKQRLQTTYLMVRRRTWFPGIPYIDLAKFVQFIQPFERIAHKYWMRYVAWFYRLKRLTPKALHVFAACFFQSAQFA